MQGSIVGSCITSTLAAGQSCAIVSNIFSGTSSDNQGLRHSGAGTINITGNCATRNTGSTCSGVNNAGTGVINITGNCFGATSNSYGAHNQASGTINITGNCYNGSGGATCFGAANQGSGVMNITGDCIASGNASSAAVINSSGAITIIGSIQGSNAAPGFIGSSNYGVPGTVVLTGPFLTSSQGQNPVSAARWMWPNGFTSASRYEVRTADLAFVRPLYTANSVGGNPATTNVRGGTIYGPNNELTGTLAVPPAGSVAIGVPVDNTVGTAAINAPTAASIAQAVWAATSRTITDAAQVRTELAAELARMLNAATTQEVGEIVEGALTATPY